MPVYLKPDLLSMLKYCSVIENAKQYTQLGFGFSYAIDTNF